MSSGGSSGRLSIISRLQGHEGSVKSALLLQNEEGVLSVGDDKTFRVWLKRSSGQYWPSICHNLSGIPETLFYAQEIRRVLIGLDNGQIHDFAISEDFNSLVVGKSLPAHQGKVSGVILSVGHEVILSVSFDKFLQAHCSERGVRLFCYKFDASCTCMAFDEAGKSVFVGDYSGNVNILRLHEKSFQHVTSFKGHSGSIRSMVWDNVGCFLYSGGFDKQVIAWDVGGGQGTAFELAGHTGKVEALAYSLSSKQLFSLSSVDQRLVIWKMSLPREETPLWEESDVCQKCEKPFFWNFRGMWSQKQIGIRQHHCRKCGKALCAECSPGRSVYPHMGFEFFQVRFCEECLGSISEADKVPLARDIKLPGRFRNIDLNYMRNTLLSIGTDGVIYLYDIRDILHEG